MAMVPEGGRRLAGNGTAFVADLPVISVVTVVRNGVATLERAIRSVVEQDYPNLEFLIIDGGSDDGTLEILERWTQRIAYWRSEPDSGIYDAWNKGVDLAGGDWIAFLGADDAFRPGAISAYARRITEAGDALDFISSRAALVGTTGRLLRVIGRPWSWPAFQRYMTVAHVGSMHHRRLFERLGRFDETYRICGDYEFLLRAGAGLRAGFMDEITVTMADGGISGSGLAALREQKRAKLETGKRPTVSAMWEYGVAIAKFRARKLLNRLRQAHPPGKTWDS